MELFTKSINFIGLISHIVFSEYSNLSMPNKKYSWMPVFKVGTWKPLNREPFTASKEFVKKVVDKTKALGDTVIPFVLNHPKDEAVSFGGFRASDVRVNGDYLEILPSEVNSGLAEQFNAGKFRGVSVKIGTDGVLKHLGFLTDFPPAVTDLPGYAFAGEDEGSMLFEFSGAEFGDNRVSYIGEIFQKLRDALIAKSGVEAADAVYPQYMIDRLKEYVDDVPQYVLNMIDTLQNQIFELQNSNESNSNIFSTNEEKFTVTIEELQAKLDASEARNLALEKDAAENRLARRKSEFTQFCGSDEMKNRIPPAIRTDVVEFMSAIDSEEKMEFAGGGQMTTVEKFQSILKKLPKVVNTDGSVMGEPLEASGDDDSAEARRIAEKHNKARGV